MFDSPAVKGVASASVRKCLAEVTVPDNAKNILLENPALLKRLAKYAVQQCFRNTVLEEFHAGTVPDSRNGDFWPASSIRPSARPLRGSP